MFKINTLNNISPQGLACFPQNSYQVGTEHDSPDALILRSYNLHDVTLSPSIKAVGRAGAGVNNIPVEKLSQLGVPVFNAPGANANAVKELVLAGMLLASRNICQAWSFTKALPKENSLSKEVESVKKQFAGFELAGRTLGVVGLGAIGVRVANAALSLGMQVVGYDPTITVRRAWELSSQVKQAANLEDLVQQADYITCHVPLLEATKNLVNDKLLESMKNGVVLLNFSRAGIVDEAAVLKGLEAGKVGAYVCDFPTIQNLDHPGVIALPHLGASTQEAEDNCAVMVVNQVRHFLETGNILNSVNFPEVELPCSEGAFRVAVANANVPNMVGQISTVLAESGLNILDLINKSRSDLAYTLIDVNAPITAETETALAAIDGVLSVRVLPRC